MKTLSGLLIVFLLLTAYGVAHAQSPSPIVQLQKCFGGSLKDSGYSIAATPDGGCVIAGSSGSTDGNITCSGGLLLKLDSNGSTKWSKCYTWRAITIKNTPDGGVIAIGSTTNSAVPGYHASHDVLVTKLDSLGQVQWQRAYGGSGPDVGANIIPVTGGYVFIAETQSSDGDVPLNNGIPNIWVVQTDQSGNMIWSKVYSGGFPASAATYPRASIQQTMEGGYVFEASIYGGHTFNVWIVKLTSTGQTTWDRLIGSGTGGDIKQTQDGGYIASSTGTRLFRLNSDGSIRWSRVYGSNGFNAPSKLLIDPNGDFIVAGKYTFGSGATSDINGWVFKIKDQPGGPVLWSKTFGGTNGDSFDDIVFGTRGELFITGTTASGDGDVSGFHGQTDLWFLKMQTLNIIKGTVFIDNNLNGIRDAGDVNANNFLVRSEKVGSVDESITFNGGFVTSADTGIITTTVRLNNAYYNVVPASHQSVFTSYRNKDSVDFALQPIQNIRDYSISLIPLTPASPGFTAKYRLHITNAGTAVLTNKTVSFIKERMTFLTASMPPAGISGDTIRWTIASLNPNDTMSITVNVTVNAPPAVTVGNTLVLKAAIDSTGDVNSMDNLSPLRQTVTGSYDPNDKTGNFGGYITRADVLSGKALLYTIRFQNTGTDTAFNVVIQDTLDSRLYWNSIEMVSASHAYQLTITNADKLTWTFTNIKLPDSSMNEPASHGYVSYRIKPKATLLPGDAITNAASIYFDFNLPVKTNTHLTHISTAIPPPSPQVSGVVNNYCSNQGIQKGKITNLPAISEGISVAVTLDTNVLAVAADSTFTFNVGTLAAGAHTLRVVFANVTDSDTLRINFLITAAVTPDVDLSANIVTVVNLNDPVVITASNVSGGGANPSYEFSKDRNFGNLIQLGTNNVLNIPAATLTAGDNWIYVRMRTSTTCYTSQFGIDSIKITQQLPIPNQPMFTGLAANYCNNQGAQKVKISNYPPQGSGITVTVKLDGNNLTLAADSSFSFNVSTLVQGNHVLDVTYANSFGTKTTTANFTITPAVTPDVNLTASPGAIVNNESVTITASNAFGGGTSPLYTFAKDRSFTNIIQPESANNTLTLAPAYFLPGDNKVYVRMKTSATCYTQQTAIDSIVITKFGTTGLIDPDYPDQRISFNPNPFRSRLTIHGISAAKEYTVTLYSQQGRLVQTIRIVNRSTTILYLPGLPAGVYMVSIYDETKKRLAGTVEVVK